MSVTPWLFDLKMLCVGVQIEERSHCPSTFGPNCIFLLKKEMHEILNLTQPSLSAWKWQGMISGTFASTTLICWMTHNGLVVNTRESSSSPPTWWENTNLIHQSQQQQQLLPRSLLRAERNGGFYPQLHLLWDVLLKCSEISHWYFLFNFFFFIMLGFCAQFSHHNREQ